MAYKFPEKIFATKINTYIQCPFKFKCQNDKLVSKKFLESPESFVGTAIHATLKDFFDITKLPIDKRKDADLGLMLRHAWGRIPKNGRRGEFWNAEDRLELFGSIEQEKAFGLGAITMLNNFRSQTNLSALPLSLEDWMEGKVGNYIIAGRIDRIDQETDSTIAVWDYKTGKLPFHNSVEKIIEGDLPIYALIASQRNPFADRIKAGLIYVKYAKTYEIEWTKGKLSEIEQKVIAKISKAETDDSLLPKINNLCPWCEYQDVCPSKDKIEQKNQKIDETNW
jgi:putative RecB family exonuclease